jgi:hypothetical protein
MSMGPVYDDTLAMLVTDALEAYSTMLALERGRRGEHMLELARDASELAAQVKACDAGELARAVRTPASDPGESVAMHYQAAPVTLTQEQADECNAWAGDFMKGHFRPGTTTTKEGP